MSCRDKSHSSCDVADCQNTDNTEWCEDTIFKGVWCNINSTSHGAQRGPMRAECCLLHCLEESVENRDSLFALCCVCFTGQGSLGFYVSVEAEQGALLLG